jgi:hypothetical protein
VNDIPTSYWYELCGVLAFIGVVLTFLHRRDRDEPRRLAVLRARRGEPEMVQLPAAVCIPTSWRKEKWK